MSAHSPRTASLRDVVRAATRTVHERLEQRLDVAGSEWSIGRYAAFLRATRAVAVPLERDLATHLGAHVASNDRVRPATVRLTADLQALGTHVGDCVAERLPAVTDAASAFGAAYVLEGSQLGGQVIADVLRRRLELGADAFTYLCPPDHPVGPRWRGFVAALDTFGRTSDSHAWDATVFAALDTFAVFASAFVSEGVIDAEPHGARASLERVHA